MPQLDLYPWFMTFLFSWLVFLMIMPGKVLGHIFPNDPSPQAKQEEETQAWTWSWQ